jgi:hypothetical protein
MCLDLHPAHSIRIAPATLVDHLEISFGSVDLDLLLHIAFAFGRFDVVAACNGEEKGEGYKEGGNDSLVHWIPHRQGPHAAGRVATVVPSSTRRRARKS